MKKTIALIAALLLMTGSTAQAAGGETAFLQSLGDIGSSFRLNPSVVKNGFVPAEFREPTPNGFLSRLNKARRSIYKKVLPAIVSVKAGNSLGSGFIVDPKGIVLTNHHVIAGAKGEVVLEFHDGKTVKAEILSSGPGRDIAILQIQDDFKDWPALRISESDTMREGDIVFALGNPVGLGISFSQGTLSRRRQGTVSFWLDLVQSDIQISQGNSGGPLLDLEGRVIGMNTAITGTGGRIGLAVQGYDLWKSLQEYAKTGQLVDGYADFGLVEVAGPGIDPTAIVNRVGDGSVAGQAGLAIGDEILSYDGHKVERNKKNQFGIFNAFGRKKPGDSVTLEVRSGKKVTFRIANPIADLSGEAYLSGSEGVILIGEGNQDLLAPIMQFGVSAEVLLEKDGEGLALEVITIAPDGSFAVFRITDKAKRPVPAGAVRSIQVPVEEFSNSAEDGAADAG